MKYLPNILLLWLCSWTAWAGAQTPYDSFAPEMSRPILDKDSVDAWRKEQQMLREQEILTRLQQEPLLVAFDMQQQMCYLLDTAMQVLAYTPIPEDVQRWLSVDPLVDKNISTSPYLYCNGNPVMFIDPMGLDTLHFNSDGTFNNRIVANGEHVGILHNKDGSSRTMRFVNQSDADRFCIEGSNEDLEMQAMRQKPLYGIHQVSAKTIYSMTARAGSLGRALPSLISKLLYAGLSGKQGGAADYNRLDEPFLKMGSNDGQVWAYIAEGSSYIQDSYNFGNMLWGQTMQQIGIPLGLTLLGAHGYTLIDPKYHSLDSMDDQHSIIMGYLYSIIRHF